MEKYLEEVARSPEFTQLRRSLCESVRTQFPEVLSIDKFADYIAANYEMFRGIHSSAEVHELFAEYRLLCAGDKHYSVHENLVRKLSATNLARVPASFVRLPFDTIKLLVPHGAVSFDVVGEEPQWAREVFISEMAPSEETDTKGLSRANPREGVGGVKIVLHNPPNFSYFWVWLNKSEVHECVEDSIEFVKNQLSSEEYRKMVRDAKTQGLATSGLPAEEITREIDNNLQFDEVKAQRLREQFEFVLKCVLYINGANADVYWHDEQAAQQAALARVKSNKKKRKLVQRVQGSAPHYRVGYNIILTRAEKEMYKNVASGLWKVTSKFIVQGHFRQQAHGAKHALRKTIFIEPFYKGSEFSDEVQRQHVVK